MPAPGELRQKDCEFQRNLSKIHSEFKASLDDFNKMYVAIETFLWKNNIVHTYIDND